MAVANSMFCRVQLAGFVLAMLTLATFSGCGPKQATVRGTVTLPDKTPAKHVVVTFSDRENQVGAAGETDDTGAYQIRTEGAADGVPTGKYQVSVTQPGPADSSQGEPPRLFPKRYESPDTSGLTFEVKDGPNMYDIQLEAQ